jgi:hypothetical protein
LVCADLKIRGLEGDPGDGDPGCHQEPREDPPGDGEFSPAVLGGVVGITVLIAAGGADIRCP